MIGVQRGIFALLDVSTFRVSFSERKLCFECQCICFTYIYLSLYQKEFNLEDWQRVIVHEVCSVRKPTVCPTAYACITDYSKVPATGNPYGR